MITMFNDYNYILIFFLIFISSLGVAKLVELRNERKALRLIEEKKALDEIMSEGHISSSIDKRYKEIQKKLYLLGVDFD